MLNSKHSKKIAISFALVLGLMLIMIIFDLSRMYIMQSKLDSIVKGHTVKANLMMTMRHGIYERQVSLRNILLLNDVFERDAAKTKFNSFALDIITARNEFASMQLDAREKVILAEINDSMAKAYKAQLSLIDTSIYNDEKIITKEDLQKTFVTQEHFIEKLKKMIRYQSAGTKKAVMDANKSYSEAKKSAFILGGGALLLGCFIAIYIINLTESQSKDVDKAMSQLETSHLQLEERVKIRTRELAEARDDALASNKAKDTFLATMSHELRTPLNIIVGYSELLEEVAGDIDTDNLINDLKKIQAAAYHQLKLINSLLDISKIEKKQLEITAEDFDVEILIKKVSSAVQPLMVKNNNAFTIKCENGIGMMYSDSMRIYQILLNILSNAAKFTFDGKVELNISKTNKGDIIVFNIKDSGIGIAKEYIGSLFDEFSQEDSTTTRKYGGSGLGLSISKRLAKLLKGDITVESNKNIGTCFRLTIPVVYIESRA